ncbi:hypothetical protein [Azospirillum picis]|uniref:Uncharacterized protein n=1 Tax=Azospirillum picis TaxID=488438 RepID=A0ABU0MEE8_9PROT|nr:hypothetical protein [Azospirillum picis]MBP2297348.1 hypothetical protein [Azospirillum picis]MDQ0531629.1 hypothetical protein [Azospirillum picis]
MFTAASFRVGDRVTIRSGQSIPQSIATVERYTHDGRCMVLSDGSEWRADGRRQWGFRGSYYKGPVVEPFEPGDDDFVAKRRSIGALRKFADGLTMDTPLTAEALRRILDVVDKEKASAQGAAKGD